MEEFAKVLAVVSKHTGISRTDILNGSRHRYARARGMLCHIIYNSLPHLKNIFLTTSGKSLAVFCQASDKADRMVDNSFFYRQQMNFIRTELGLPVLKSKIPENISPTMRLFGFDYTEKDIMRREIAIHNSSLYMERLCSIGRPPLKDGLVFTVNKKVNPRKWYMDNM